MHPDEIVADGTQARQAGASAPDGAWIREFRAAAEGSLYFFLTAVLGRTFLTPTLHKPICDFVQDPAFQRKFLAMFRGGGKSTIISQGLPIHCFIQPKERNLYWPGKLGVDTRLLLACETITRGRDHLAALRMILESNRRLRALWPHVVWPNPDRDARVWNNEEFVLPRVYEQSRAEPSMRCVGTDAATAGMHPDGKIEDDIIAEKAANSPIVMETTRNWHRSSRSLINHPGAREWSLGTFWAVEDVYQTEHMQDPSVHVRTKALVEDGVIQWPERYVFTDAEAHAWYAEHETEILQGTVATKVSIEQLQREHGVFFPLFYLNDPTNAALTDFQPQDLRHFRQEGEMIVLDDDPRDVLLRERGFVAEAPPLVDRRGAPIQWTGQKDDDPRMEHRREYLRWRRA